MEGETEGYIAFKKPWPGIMRTVYGNQERFESTYFSRFPGYYMSGDGARRDADGYLWITGRVDDMLNCSGKYINTYLLCTDFRSTESYACLLIEIKNFMTTWFLRDIENRNTIFNPVRIHRVISFAFFLLLSLFCQGVYRIKDKLRIVIFRTILQMKFSID